MAAKPSSLHRILILAFTFAILFAGCNGPGGAASTQTIPIDPSVQAATPDEPTVVPSETLPTARVWLVTGPGSEESHAAEISAKLGELSAQSGYLFQQSESPAESDLRGAKAVFWLGDPAELNRLASAAPQTAFVWIGSGEVDPAANISQIRLSPARVSFVAGLIAILVAPDRRAGGLFTAEDPLNGQQIDAFNNGARYLCGRCSPVYAPVIPFPLTSAVAGGQGFEAWKTAFDQLDQSRIESLYLAPEGVSPEMLDYLAAQSVVVVGSAAPPDGYGSLWAATVAQDPAAALEGLWEGLIQEEAPAQTINAPILLRDVNDLILTPGRRELVEKIAAELNEGWIDPLSVP